MSMQQGRGGMGSHKHGVSDRAGPPNAVKRFVAQFFNKEVERRGRRQGPMYTSVRETLENESGSRSRPHHSPHS